MRISQMHSMQSGTTEQKGGRATTSLPQMHFWSTIEQKRGETSTFLPQARIWSIQLSSSMALLAKLLPASMNVGRLPVVRACAYVQGSHWGQLNAHENRHY